MANQMPIPFVEGDGDQGLTLAGYRLCPRGTRFRGYSWDDRPICEMLPPLIYVPPPRVYIPLHPPSPRRDHRRYPRPRHGELEGVDQPHLASVDESNGASTISAQEVNAALLALQTAGVKPAEPREPSSVTASAPQPATGRQV